MDYWETTFNDLREAIQDAWDRADSNYNQKVIDIIDNLEKRIEECCDCLQTIIFLEQVKNLPINQALTRDYQRSKKEEE